MSLPYFTTAEVAGIEDMLRLLINYIVSKELITFSGDFRYQRIIRYFESRLTEKITLADVAKHLKISESTLTHFLRKEHGITFKRLLLRKRLEKAEEGWRRDPGMTVGEAAALAGYEDYHYFSRLYRQERGFPPGEFRRRLKPDRGKAAERSPQL